MSKTQEQLGGESKESLQQLIGEVERISAQIKELKEKKRSISIERQIEDLSKSRAEKMEKIADRDEVGDNIIVALLLPNDGLDPVDLRQIGLEISKGESISSEKIRKHLQDNGWIDLGAMPDDPEDYNELEGQLWVKR